ncbi:MAG: GAF domain-containing protein [Candidatus Poribacteria bacterium]|nr:GAF domain-containing protein [Candidatus Poribacteria bacterium]
MRSVLIIGEPGEFIDQMRRILPDGCSVFSANSNGDALELIRNISVDLVLMDVAVINNGVLSTATKIKSDEPSCVVLCTLNEESPAAESPYANNDEHQIFDFFIRKPILSTDVRRVIQNAFEKQALLQELADLRNEAEKIPSNHVIASGLPYGLSSDTSNLMPLLTAVTKTLSTGFDLDRLMHLFLESVAEMLRLNRASLATYDSVSGEYRIQAHRGLLPQLATNIRLKAEDALPSWLIREGRLITRSEAESLRLSPTFRQISTQLQGLQAVASIPLIARGNLVGILNIGPRVTGIPYTNSELETLFILASQVAVSIQDTRMYHEIQYQKTYIENILTHMSSGVITIDSDEKVVIYNRRAAEILDIPESRVLNKDLRALPSPLGDLLFATLRDGKNSHKMEISLPLRQIPLEVSTYQIKDGKQTVSGGVMVFEDLSQQKQLEQERRRSIELDLFNRIMGTMAHEIKNPLVSIRTFVELLPEEFENAEFRSNFYATVQDDVKRLNGLVEKIVAFADSTPHDLQLSNIETLLNECIRLLKEEGVDPELEIALICPRKIPPIRCDTLRTTRAFLYLLRYLVQGVELPAKVDIQVNLSGSNGEKKTLEIEMTCSGKVAPPEPLSNLFSPFSDSQLNIEDLGLSVSQRIIGDRGGRIEAKPSADGKLIFVIQLGIG